MEDWKKKIEDSARDMKVPDSLQPGRIEEKLYKKSTIRPFYRKPEFMTVAAAAVVLLFVGGAWVFQRKAAVDMSGSVEMARDVAESAVATEEDMDDSVDAGMADEEVSEEIAESTGTEVPDESFENYYHTTTYEELEKQMEAVWKIQEREYGAAEDGEVLESAEEDTGGGSYSTTNLQVEGVDEGDIVKTDGTYVYILSAGSWLRIVKADSLELVKEIPTEEIGSNVTYQEMYVDDGLLILAADQYENGLQESTEYTNCMEDVYYMEDSSKTILVTYDISDPLNPRLAGKVSQDGCYRTSRKVGDYVYLFSDYYCRKDGSKDNGAWIPEVDGRQVAEDEIYVPDIINDSTYLLMSSVNVKNPGSVEDEKALLHGGGQFYITTSSIYVIRYNWISDKNGGQEYTDVIRFSMGNGKIQAAAASSLKGDLTDSFAVNEYDGYLRILLTDWSSTSDNEPVNRVYVLDEKMKVCGKIDQLAPGEMIYSARFMGEKGYFVTYRNTDPLFSVDFSDPENPQILGELKVTGFSEYLHFYGEGKMLGLGWETDPDSGKFLGLKLSMYDISDSENVEEENKLILKGMDYCSGLYEYKAVLADAEENLIGLAVESYDQQYCQKYLVFSYSRSEGFVKEMECDLGSTERYTSTENVRGLYIGDVLYVAEEQKVTAFDRKNQYEKLGTLELN